MLALFDLDHTLIHGDSDYAWGCFLCERGHVDAKTYETTNRRFYRDYQAGTLDIHAFLAFALQPLREIPEDQLLALRTEFLEEKIRPMLQPAAGELLERHRAQGDTLAIITSTNRFITAPIAELLGVAHLLATDPERVDGRFTGRVAGVPCFREGKIERLEAWARERGVDPFTAWFYSDSINDLPLLERVAKPVAVDPDPDLKAAASRNGWPVISLREPA